MEEMSFCSCSSKVHLINVQMYSDGGTMYLKIVMFSMIHSRWDSDASQITQADGKNSQ